ncbi:alpha/beta fold hydrolase [Corynebacterium cystitidis]|uniref:TAP-like protein n=2 Tax=Corynebacterium cystitidis TaxID=35757 RepID=A0A1H9RYJ2_9CORY|nr:alpha/beta hydrolase [Corynebacterium cystitidis]SER77708.1 TAP-like protein [Corynebacterium cystitidis DSM 20524]SNV78784.1 Alpha/beta hydrolase family [Corynebacterium cystitidis]
MARAYRRQLLWDGTIEKTRELAPKIRKLAEIYPQAELAHVVQVVYEFAGSQVLSDLADAWRAGRMLRLWKWLAILGSGEVEGAGTPFLVEPDLVQGISFGEAGYGLAPDGEPLDPQLFFQDAASRMPPFTGPPVDLRKAAKNYRFPVLVLSGARDLRTPLPVAQRLAELIPDAYLAIHPDHGHSFLDTHPFFALQVVDLVRSGNIQAVARHMDALRTIRQPATQQLLWRVLAGSARIARLKMGY